MGIRFNCPNGHKLNVKEFLAGKRGVCPQCGAKFIIPMPAEAPAAELPLSVGSGLSQSIEIAAAPALSHPVASPPAAQSAIIPVADADFGTLELEPPPALPTQPIPATDALPASIIAPQAPVDATIAAAESEAVVGSKRERGRRDQILISFLLLGLVVLLAGVLIWVLKREANKAPIEKAPAAQEPAKVSAAAYLRAGVSKS